MQRLLLLLLLWLMRLRRRRQLLVLLVVHVSSQVPRRRRWGASLLLAKVRRYVPHGPRRHRHRRWRSRLVLLWREYDQRLLLLQRGGCVLEVVGVVGWRGVVVGRRALQGGACGGRAKGGQTGSLAAGPLAIQAVSRGSYRGSSPRPLLGRPWQLSVPTVHMLLCHA